MDARKVGGRVMSSELYWSRSSFFPSFPSETGSGDGLEKFSCFFSCSCICMVNKGSMSAKMSENGVFASTSQGRLNSFAFCTHRSTISFLLIMAVDREMLRDSQSFALPVFVKYFEKFKLSKLMKSTAATIPSGFLPTINEFNNATLVINLARTMTFALSSVDRAGFNSPQNFSTNSAGSYSGGVDILRALPKEVSH